jgi:hypothetical protein
LNRHCFVREKTIIVNIMIDFTDYIARLTEFVGSSGTILSYRKGNSSLNDAPIILGTVAFSILVLVQTLTDANPIGRCLRFWKQLSEQVSVVVCRLH